MNTSNQCTTTQTRLCQSHHMLFATLNTLGAWLGDLPIRLLLAYEFGESGIEKLHGTNWFADIKDQFPFPFNLVDVNLSWGMATWFELIGAVALVLGLGTRFFAVSLSILTIVAIYAVHWPYQIHSLHDLALGFVVSNDNYNDAGNFLGNFKLPLIYLVMFVPLILKGAGQLSVDALLGRLWSRRCKAKQRA